MEKIKKIMDHATYQKILKENCGGVCYFKSPSDYEAQDLMILWNDLTAAEKEVAGGIMEGVFDFLNNK